MKLSRQEIKALQFLYDVTGDDAPRILKKSLFEIQGFLLLKMEDENENSKPDFINSLQCIYEFLDMLEREEESK